MRFPAGMDDIIHPDPLDEVAALVRHGIVARIWIFLIGADGSLQRAVQQIDGIPVSPDAHAVLALRGILARTVDRDEEVVAVIERPAAPAPTPDDWAWHDAIRSAARGLPVPVRGVLLAHLAGVEVLAPRTLAA